MKNFKFILFLFFLVNIVHAQEKKPPFWNDIQAFKKQDKIQPPPPRAILFVGSSSFTKWTDVQDYFPDYKIINRGFGGSTLTDVIRYESDVIFKYEPKQIVIYCGENDLAFSDSITAQIVFQRFRQLFADIRSIFPKVPILYVSMKPSPSRWKLKEKMIAGNELIKKFLNSNSKTVFVDVWKDMLGPDGTPMKDIFLDDNL
ncbi:MAG TPA: GDSL-type esterase/lipase family protein, partial [Chitinophagaceae bacterium]|nr:GDSL-type esterase/lipase family protein [Chitinophagaceae bacterium]